MMNELNTGVMLSLATKTSKIAAADDEHHGTTNTNKKPRNEQCAGAMTTTNNGNVDDDTRTSKNDADADPEAKRSTTAWRASRASRPTSSATTSTPGW
ncbi:hypothetical protein P3T76_006658 [Phytophthora citrophthora]|uniref:Uncharacterized protein n=1 Tax=Phytophthora citrophthora TaxID=4793 RepID=A0AAD9GP21_9STRA|nr:hypothetical protein P3T76_015185 [Phytophthora citrophthora]KAK1942329.1 hypothetical protein P3T76_006651 [Phytophthora citrophthora]KAK1942336.1 hypothetical protein P3T76_006658 [Phytophthora citrophthora]